MNKHNKKNIHREIVRLFILAVLILTFSCKRAELKGVKMTEDDFKSLRHKMVESQIEARGIKDSKVLEAMREIPRHEFVEDAVRDQAYNDYPIPIGEGQTISQPYIVGIMTELLAIKGHEKVLEIGTGSGYQAAVLSKLVKEVYTIEIINVLAKRAQATLKKLEFNNVKIKSGDGYKGWKEHAPFDAIILTAAPPKIPQPLIDQLALGGVLVAPIGVLSQELVRIKKEKGKLARENIIPVRFVPMTGEINRK